MGAYAIQAATRTAAQLRSLYPSASSRPKLGLTVMIGRNDVADEIFTLADEPSEDAVEIYISRLRKKLDGSSAAIVTLRGLGYLLRKKEDDQ